MLLPRFIITLRASNGSIPPLAQAITRLTVKEAIDGAIRKLRLHRRQLAENSNGYDEWAVAIPQSRVVTVVVARGDVNSTLDDYRDDGTSTKDTQHG